jgi:hypothetical protein
MSGFGDPNVYQPRAPANPRLLKALSSSTTDPQARLGFYEALMNSVVLLPTSSVASDSTSIIADKKFLLIEDEKGVPAVCAFTDLAAMQRWQPGSTAFFWLPMPQFLRESFPASAGGIWINIADRSARFVSRQELSQVTSGLICPSYATQVEKELAPVHAEFEPHLPPTLPDELLARIITTVRREGDIASAYVMELDPKPKKARLCVGLRLTRLLEEPQIDQLLRRVARQINVRRLHRGTIDVIILDFAKHKTVAGKIPAAFERA